jgi:hypothetical protein
MAGGTKSYKVTKGPDGSPVKELVSFHPKYASRPADAVTIVRNGGTAYVAPHNWQAFEEAWNHANTQGADA